MLTATNHKLAHPFQSVNSALNTQLPLFPESMIHQRNSHKYIIRGNITEVRRQTSYYGVSKARRALSPQLFFKRYDQIRDCLESVLGLSIAEREFTLRAATFGAYYGNCYAKISTLCQEPGCSKATAFRVLRKLKDQHLIEVIPRILTPFRRQISSLITFQKLFLLIARYLAEHGAQFFERWLQPYLSMPGCQFWSRKLVWRTPGPLPGTAAAATGCRN